MGTDTRWKKSISSIIYINYKSLKQYLIREKSGMRIVIKSGRTRKKLVLPHKTHSKTRYNMIEFWHRILIETSNNK